MNLPKTYTYTFGDQAGVAYATGAKIWTASEFDALTGEEIDQLGQQGEEFFVVCTNDAIKRIENTEILYGEGWKIVGFEER